LFFINHIGVDIMKKLLVLLALLTMVGAASAAEMKVGIVDMQTVFQKSQTVAKMRATLQKQFAPKEQAIKSKQKLLQDDIGKYKRDSAIMKDSDRDVLEQKISAEQQELGNLQSELQNQVASAQNKDMQVVYNKVQQAVSTVAKKQGINLVLAKASVVYNDSNTIDITDQVLKIVG
jgi:outer membrane protein